MTRFGDFLSERLEAGGFTTEDVLASIVPLMRQVIETHQVGMVAPLDGLDALSVERSAIWFEESQRRQPATNNGRLRTLDRALRSGVEVVGEHSRTVEVGLGTAEVEDLSIGRPGDEISRPVYLPGYRSWEHVVDHHDPLVDVFSLGMIIASLACGLDLRDPDELRAFVANRKNLFALSPGLHPVIAKAVINMTELSRHRRPQDLRAVMRSLENYRDQEVSFDFDLASIEGFGEQDLHGKQQIILGRLQERLFEISRRNRLLHFRDTAGTVCLTDASVPLSFDIDSIRPDQILTWGGRFASELSNGQRVSLNRFMNFREALYLAPTLDTIRAEALRDRAEFGFEQLRVVLCFLRWANVKAKPPELFYSPFVLLSVRLVKKKGVRDTYHLEPHTTIAEINPVLRHMLKQLYDIDLPETVDLAVVDLDELYRLFKGMVESSDAAVTVAKVERPRIELIHDRAKRRLAAYRRKVRISGRGLRHFMDLDYSYNPANFHPLGLRIFNAWIRPVETHLDSVLQERPRPRHYFAASSVAGESVRERQLFVLRDGDEGNPFAWEFDLCKVTLGNFRYRKMTLVRDYAELLERPRTSSAFDATFSLSPRVVEMEEAAAPPLEERYDIVECDPTQAVAIGLARAGASYIIQGPPGTGKSQTITNLISDYVSRGQRVLFVCEKRAALDVVYSRLTQRGLQELCCLIHDSQTDKREFVMDLKQTYETFVSAAAQGHHHQHRSRRRRLDDLLREESAPLADYADAIQQAPDDTGTSVQSVLTRGIELDLEPPELPPLLQERVPMYGEWLKSRPAIDAFTAKLSGLQQDVVLAHHPLRMLNGFLHELERPLEQVVAALDETEPLLEAFLSEVASRSLGELCGSLQSAAEVAALATDARLLADQGLLALLDSTSSASERLADSLQQWEQAEHRVRHAEEATVHWRQKLPASEMEPALAEAARFEGRHLAFLSPAWWRLRRVLRERYDFTAHAIRPTFSRVLQGLQEEYEARSHLQSVREKLADRLGIQGEIETTVECVVAMRRRAEDPHQRSLIEGLLAGPDPDGAVRALADLETNLMTVQEVLGEVLQDHEQLPLESLVDVLMAVRESLDDLPEFLVCLSDLAAMRPVVASAFRHLELTPRQLEAASIRRTLDAVYRSHRSLRMLDAVERDRRGSRLLTAHQKMMEVNTQLLREQVRSRFIEHLRLASLPAAQLSRDEQELKKQLNRGRRDLEHEFGKTMRYKAIRDLVSGESGLVVDDLKPIWLMSPLSVSDTLPLEEGRFDVVIFDEASQITLEEAVPALFRAPQAIVVGDEMQLPPTNFFSAKLDDESSTLWLEDDGEMVEYDLSINSFLTHAAKNLPSRMLGWHYRSRSESLISFSNWAFYQGRLLTVPEEELSARQRPEITVADPQDGSRTCADLLDRSISFHLMTKAVYRQRRNRAEADYIAHLVRGVLACPSNPSIGIVAFSEAQQGEIQEALERLGHDDRSFGEQLESELTREEDGQFVGLLVKNLENIQGDERDVIILSVCYGPGPDGRMRMNFGPINQLGGERRLNVAFSRAKHHMAVVSSIQYHSITNDYNEGARCLKRYLQYAEASSVGASETVSRVLRELCLWRDPDEWETSGAGDVVAHQIAAALQQHGYHVDQSVGMSDFRCDLAVRREGDEVYRLGVLLDSGSYYRDDDLLEREVFKPRLLHSFGWTIARVLSREWYEDRDAVMRRLLAMLEGQEPTETIARDEEFDHLLEERLAEALPMAEEAGPAVGAAASDQEPAESSITSPILAVDEGTSRYFEYIGGTSRKFWEVTFADNRFSVRFGRIGTAGQERVKSFADAAAARRAAERMISEKIGKGYEEKPRPE